MYQAELASLLSQFGKTEVEFNVSDDEGIMPQTRKSLKIKNEKPSAEDIEDLKKQACQMALQEWEQAQALLEAEKNKPDYYKMMEQVLDSNIAPGTYEAVRKALKDMGGEKVVLGDIQMDVTYDKLTKPENVEDELKKRIEKDLGPGSFTGIKTVLKMMGFEDIKILRKSNINL